MYLESDYFSSPMATSLVQATIISVLLFRRSFQMDHPDPSVYTQKAVKILPHLLSHPPMTSHPIRKKPYDSPTWPVLPYPIPSSSHFTFSFSPLCWFHSSQIPLRAVPELARHASASGPLCLLFPYPGKLVPSLSCLHSSFTKFKFFSKATFSVRLSLSLYLTLRCSVVSHSSLQLNFSL